MHFGRMLQATRRQAVTLAAFVVMAVSMTGCATAPDASPDAPLHVMSFNVRLPLDADGANRWQARRDMAARMIHKAAPDVIGTQELFKTQGDDLTTALPGYTWFGRGRRGDDSDEHMGVFYRTDRLRVLESGDFWLSDMPSIPGSISWGHPYPRMVTWALFERVADHRRFYLFNTHLPYREQDEPARVRGARLLDVHIATLPADVPVVVTGDFNTAPDQPTHAQMTRQLRDAWEVADQRAGPAGTFHAFTGVPQQRIDWILVRGLHVRRFRTIDTGERGRYPSDHFPVLAELDFVR